MEKFIDEFYKENGSLKFSSLLDTDEWVNFPVVFQLKYIEKYNNYYSSEDSNYMLKYSLDIEADFKYYTPEEITKRIIFKYEYILKGIPISNPIEKMKLLTKLKDLHLRNMLNGKDSCNHKEVLLYVNQMIDEVMRQEPIQEIEEIEEVEEIKSNFKLYQNEYRVALAKINDYNHFKESNFFNELFIPFSNLFLIGPNILKSTDDKYEVFNLNVLKENFEKAIKGIELYSSTFEQIIEALDENELKFNNAALRNRELLLAVDVRRIIKRDRLENLIQFQERQFLLIGHFKNYIKKNFVDFKKNRNFPKDIKKVIKDMELFSKVLNKLNEKGFVVEVKNKYRWKDLNPRFNTLILKLCHLNLLEKTGKNEFLENCKTIGKLLDFEINSNYNKASRASEEYDLFSFLNTFKNEKERNAMCFSKSCIYHSDCFPEKN